LSGQLNLGYPLEILKSLILMDGADLMAVLEGRIDLGTLLLRKRRHASQTGNIYLKIHELLRI